MKLGIEYIASDKDTHFTGGIVQHGIALASISFPSTWITTNIYDCIIESVTIQSVQNQEWEVFIFSSSSANNTDIDEDTFVDSFTFPIDGAIDGTAATQRIANTGQYYYRSPSNNIKVPYRDSDNTSKIHIGLVNRSLTSKLAGDTGQVKVRLSVRPIYAS